MMLWLFLSTNSNTRSRILRLVNSLELRPRFHIGRFEPVARAPLPLAVLLLLALSGCASIVHTVATELDLNTVQLRRALENSVPAHAHAISDAKDRKILARHRLSRDEKTRWRLQRLVDGIVSNSHKKQMRLQVRLLDDPTPNAFVTGAGYVYVFQGLLDQVESEDEIATILGHEIAHIDAGHIARRMRTQFWTSLALVTADALTKGETADEIIKAARALIPPAFSRNHEREADILGTIYAGRTGFEPTRINDFFRRSWAKEERMRAAWESDLRTSERSHRRGNLCLPVRPRELHRQSDELQLLGCPLGPEEPADHGHYLPTVSGQLCDLCAWQLPAVPFAPGRS